MPIANKHTVYFHHNDGRTFDKICFVDAPEPMWMRFDEEIVLITGKRADGSYDVEAHPRAAEIRQTLFAEPFDQGLERAHRIATAPLDKPVPPFLGYQVREGHSVRFFQDVEAVLTEYGLATNAKARSTLRFLTHVQVAHPKLSGRALEVSLIDGPVLGPCPASLCAAVLVPITSRDGTAWEADGCTTCHRTWWHNPPKTLPPSWGRT